MTRYADGAIGPEVNCGVFDVREDIGEQFFSLILYCNVNNQLATIFLLNPILRSFSNRLTLFAAQITGLTVPP